MTEKTEKVRFEDALNMTGFGLYNYTMMLLTSSIIVAMAFETFSVAYLVPASACELETNSSNQGLMAGMPLFGILMASNIWGYLADTKGRRKILVLSLTLGFITGSLATFSTNWIVFCLLKFLSSSAMAGTFGLSITYLSECTPEKKRFTMILLISSVYLFSAGCMAALTIPILPLTFAYHIPVLNIYFNSWRFLNIIYSIPSAFAAIGVWFALESPKFYLSLGEEQKAVDILKRIFVINNERPGDYYKVQEITLDEDHHAAVKGFWASIVTQTTPLFRPPLLRNTILLSVLFVAIYFCLNPYAVWLPYMFDGFMKSLEKGESGLTFCQMLRSSQNTTVIQVTDCSLNKTAMTLVFGMDLLLASLNVVFATTMHFCGRKQMLIAIQMVSGTAAISLSACTHWVLSAVLVVIFMSGVLNFGFLSTFSVDIFPTYVKAMGVCLTLMVGRGSAVLGINILKNLLDNNCELSFYLFGGIILFGGFVGFLLPGDKKSEAKPNAIII